MQASTPPPTLFDEPISDKPVSHKPRVLLLSGYDAASHRHWQNELQDEDRFTNTQKYQQQKIKGYLDKHLLIKYAQIISSSIKQFKNVNSLPKNSI